MRFHLRGGQFVEQLETTKATKERALGVQEYDDFPYLFLP